MGQRTGHADLVALLRHALMARSGATRRERLRNPKGGWLAQHRGVAPVRHPRHQLGEDFLIEAVPWQPAWLSPGVIPDDDVFAEVFAGRLVRQSAETSIDPCVAEASDHTAYLCPGQREAVRSLLYMPAGSTLVVNLPTGSGKTLVGLVPTLLGGLSSGLTLFVVPTTALAMDQARRMRELVGRKTPAEDIPELAWHSELPQADKVVAKRRIRAGAKGSCSLRRKQQLVPCCQRCSMRRQMGRSGTWSSTRPTWWPNGGTGFGQRSRQSRACAAD